MDVLRDIKAKITGESEARAIPKGSLILVTGASGYIASHVVNEALKAGYKVRGTARSEEKCASTRKTFKDNPDYSTAVVANFQDEGTFDEAIKDVSAVIHVAGDTTFDPDPNAVVPRTIAGVHSILRSAAKTPSVKRFVLTSSSSAALLPKFNQEFTVSVDDWNQEAVEVAWAPPPYLKERAFSVYAAAKTEGEKAFWKFVKEEKPGFVANTILPNANMGRILSSPGPTGFACLDILKGNIPTLPPQYMIDVIDDARLHLIAAALDPSIQNERIFAFNVPFNWTDIIQMVHELRPDATTIAEPPENEARDLSKVPNELGAKLLKTWYGQETGYKPIKETVRENIEGQA